MGDDLQDQDRGERIKVARAKLTKEEKAARSAAYQARRAEVAERCRLKEIQDRPAAAIREAAKRRIATLPPLPDPDERAKLRMTKIAASPPALCLDVHTPDHDGAWSESIAFEAVGGDLTQQGHILLHDRLFVLGTAMAPQAIEHVRGDVDAQSGDLRRHHEEEVVELHGARNARFYRMVQDLSAGRLPNREAR